MGLGEGVTTGSTWPASATPFAAKRDLLRVLEHLMSDQEALLLKALSGPAPVFTILQCVRFFGLSETPEKIHAILNRLFENEAILFGRFLAPLPQSVERPVYEYNTEAMKPAPDFGKLAYQLKERYSRLPSREMKCVFARERFADIFGGRKPDLSKAFETQHTLQLAEIILCEKLHSASWKNYQDPVNFPLPDRLLLHMPFTLDSDDWKSSQWLKARKMHPRGYVPDIGIVFDGRLYRAIEQGGKYDKARMEQIHTACVKAKIDYQIW